VGVAVNISDLRATLKEGDSAALTKLLSGVGLLGRSPDLEPADVFRDELLRLEPNLRPKLVEMIVDRLNVLAGLARSWTTLEEEEAWNSVVLSAEFDRSPAATDAVLKVEEHLREFPAAIRRDFAAQVDRALTRTQSGSQLLPRWRAVLTSSHDPVALFRSFVGLIWGRDRELDPSDDAPVGLIREGLEKLEEQLVAQPDRARWLAQAMRTVEKTYPAQAGSWSAKLQTPVPKQPAKRASAQERKRDRPAKRMAKAELISKLAQENGKLSRRELKNVLESLATIGYKENKKTGTFLVPGFAKFVVIKKPPSKERKGINPFTKEPTVFKPRSIPKNARPQSSSNRGKAAR
jgi:DNA-binding protein HU-beta